MLSKSSDYRGICIPRRPGRDNVCRRPYMSRTARAGWTTASLHFKRDLDMHGCCLKHELCLQRCTPLMIKSHHTLVLVMKRVLLLLISLGSQDMQLLLLSTADLLNTCHKLVGHVLHLQVEP